MTPDEIIRPLEPADRQAVRDICAAAWMGEPSARHVPEDWTWAEFWTRYFTNRRRPTPAA